MSVTGRKLKFAFDVAARPRRRKVELRRWFAKASTDRQTLHVRPAQMWLLHSDSVPNRLRFAKGNIIFHAQTLPPTTISVFPPFRCFCAPAHVYHTAQPAESQKLFILLVVLPPTPSRKCFVEAIFCDGGTELAGKTKNPTFVKWFSGDCSRWCEVAGETRWFNGEESYFNVNLKSGVHGVIIRRVEQTFIRHCSG